jgi:hypothetical protein
LHVDNATNAVSLLHEVERGINLIQSLAVGDELIDLQLALQVVIYQVGKLAAAFDTTEGTALPDTAGNELECCSRYKEIQIRENRGGVTYVS